MPYIIEETTKDLPVFILNSIHSNKFGETLVTKNIFLCLLLCILMIHLSGCERKTSIELEPYLSPPGHQQSDWNVVPGSGFQIQFTGDIDLSVEAAVYELDAFETPATMVEQLHLDGKSTICYLNAGALEDWRPDTDQFPESVVGNPYSGWPGESWLDIRQLDVLMPIMEARLDVCLTKSFDAVEFDNVDGWQNETGFKISSQDQLAFNKALAEAAHARGLAAGLKNDADHMAELEDWFDFALVESCFSQGWCDQTKPFLDAGKAVFVIEYVPIEAYCQESKAASITLIQKNLRLDAWRKLCQ